MPTLETVQAAHALSLTQTRIIRAPRSRVYEAWTNPEIAKKWFGPADMYCSEATLDVRVGGPYRMVVLPTAEALAKPGAADSPRKGGTATGNYTRVVPNEMLQFTWEPSWNTGERSLVTVTLREVEGGTEVTVKHENLPTEGSRNGHNNGWTDSLQKLQAALEQ